MNGCVTKSDMMKKRMFNGYEVVQMANGILSKQSFVFEKSQDKWKEVFQCSKVSFHGKKTKMSIKEFRSFSNIG